MERKSIGFDVKDFSKSKRTAVIAHAVYNNIDRANDISVKGMFNSSWKRGEAVQFYFNHNEEMVPGKVMRTFEDEEKAYTEVKFGNYTLGDDVLEMVDFGVITGASFGYETEKKDYINKGGKKVRRLLQVRHFETSLLTKAAANPLAGVVSYVKSIDTKQLNQDELNTLMKISQGDQSTLEALIELAGKLTPNDDLYEWVTWNISRRADLTGSIRSQIRYDRASLNSIKSHIQKIEKFCDSSSASDESIQALNRQLDEYKSIVSAHDTVSTHEASDGDASVKEFADALHLLTLKI